MMSEVRVEEKRRMLTCKALFGLRSKLTEVPGKAKN